jgi:hypothetical protein
MLVYLYSKFSLRAVHQNMELCKSHPKIKKKNAAAAAA